MRELGTASPGEAIMRILEVDSPGMIATFGAEPDLVGIMQYPDAAIACDCGASRGGAHPRGFGSFPRVLGRYVRGTHALSLEDAVRKMTGLPATIVGMVDRGFLTVGMAADVTVFDAATVIDHSTYERPNELATGVALVVVNGKIALRDGAPTGVKAGRALRRTGNMPSRAMSVAAPRHVAARHEGIVIDVSQRPADRTASGSVRVVLDDGSTFASTTLGLLQTTKGWATVTGRGRVAFSETDQAFTLIVEDADPFDRGPTARIRIEGRSEVRRTLTAPGVGPR
jgi:hypothetical protein